MLYPYHLILSGKYLRVSLLYIYLLKGVSHNCISGKLPEILSGNIIYRLLELPNVAGRVSHYKIYGASIARNRMIGYNNQLINFVIVFNLF